MVAVTSTSLPLQAVIKQNISTQEMLNVDNRQLLALSWGDIWDILRRKKGKGGSRDGKDFLCMISPGKLKDPNGNRGNLVVWGTQPVFLWQGEITGIEVRHIRSNKLIWSQTLKPTTRSIIYQGEPLQPGEAYIWLAILPDEQLPNRQSFRIMKAEKRDSISTDLKELESKPKAEDANSEEIILARVEYFAKQELWSDVLRELYSVENPSPELKEKIEQIQGHDFCSIDKEEQILGFAP